MKTEFSLEFPTFEEKERERERGCMDECVVGAKLNGACLSICMLGLF